MIRLTRRDFIKIALASLVMGALAKFTFKLPKESGVVRPPGAVIEEEFLKRCIRCGRCISACSTNGSGTLEECGYLDGFSLVGTPKVNPIRAPCEALFGKCEGVLPCVKACPTGALVWVEPHQIKLGSVEWIKERCIAFKKGGCLVCYETCPVDGAISVKEITVKRQRKIITVRVPEFNPDICIGCGRCVNACPAAPKALVLTPKRAKRVIPRE